MGRTLFNAQEKGDFIEIFRPYVDLIECRKTDAKLTKKKEHAWHEISHKYNARFNGSHRTTEQLKNLWKNLKAKAKQDVIKQKKETKKTGGGVAPSMDAVSAVIVEMLPQQMHSLQNPFDCDEDIAGVSIPLCIKSYL